MVIEDVVTLVGLIDAVAKLATLLAPSLQDQVQLPVNVFAPTTLAPVKITVEPLQTFKGEAVALETTGFGLTVTTTVAAFVHREPLVWAAFKVIVSEPVVDFL